MIPFFSVAAGVAATLWVVSIALLTLVLTSPATGDALGFLSQQVRTMRALAASREVTTEYYIQFLSENSPVLYINCPVLSINPLESRRSSERHCLCAVSQYLPAAAMNRYSYESILRRPPSRTRSQAKSRAEAFA